MLKKIRLLNLSIVLLMTNRLPISTRLYVVIEIQ